MKCKDKTTTSFLTIDVKTHSCITRIMIKNCLKTDKEMRRAIYFYSKEEKEVFQSDQKQRWKSETTGGNGRMRAWSVRLGDEFQLTTEDIFLFMSIGQSRTRRNCADSIPMPHSWQTDVQQRFPSPFIFSPSHLVMLNALEELCIIRLLFNYEV